MGTEAGVVRHVSEWVEEQSVEEKGQRGSKVKIRQGLI